MFPGPGYWVKYITGLAQCHMGATQFSNIHYQVSPAIMRVGAVRQGATRKLQGLLQ